jgi:hypothetical protein
MDRVKVAGFLVKWTIVVGLCTLTGICIGLAMNGAWGWWFVAAIYGPYSAWLATV